MSASAALDRTTAQLEGALLRSDRFRQEREDEWKRLEAIVRRMEAGRLKRVPDDDLLALPELYRTAASSLAVARETSLDAATVGYLEALVQRAWFQVYGPRTGLVRWLRDFVLGGWSARVRAIWLDICVALAVMIAGTVSGWLLCARDADWYYRLVPGAMAGGRTPDATPAMLAETLGGKTEGLGAFAAYLFSNNAGVAILAFALGFAFGIPALLLLAWNTVLLGAMLWLFASKGLGLEFASWLSVHGTTELGAILLGGAAGVHVGRAMVFPGARTVLAATALAGRRAAQVMVGVVAMLVVAALLEGFVRQLVVDWPTRLLIGSAIGALWIAYIIGAGRQRAAKEPS